MQHALSTFPPYKKSTYFIVLLYKPCSIVIAIHSLISFFAPGVSSTSIPFQCGTMVHTQSQYFFSVWTLHLLNLLRL